MAWRTPTRFETGAGAGIPVDVAAADRHARLSMSCTWTCTCVDGMIDAAAGRRPSSGRDQASGRASAACCRDGLVRRCQGAFAAAGAGAGAGAATGAGATGLTTGGGWTAATVGGGAVTIGGGVTFGTVITLPANAGVPSAARPNTPTADSVVMRRDRLVILSSSLSRAGAQSAPACEEQSRSTGLPNDVSKAGLETACRKTWFLYLGRIAPAPEMPGNFCRFVEFARRDDTIV